MEVHRIPYADTDRFSPLVLGHLAGDRRVAPLRHRDPDLPGLIAAARDREFDPHTRQVLRSVLEKQYAGVAMHDAVRSNLTALGKQGTLTITTGHQLCLFTGPLFFPLKVINAVAMAARLQRELKGTPVVPVFWMATEDHDRAEIDHAWINGKKVEWPGKAEGAVGRLKLSGIEEVIAKAGELLGAGTNADRLRELLKECYKPEFTLAHATRHFVNALFGRSGVICLDADDPQLKRLFLPIMRKELMERFSEKAVEEANSRIAEDFKVQAHAREINLFYLAENDRARIIDHGGKAVPENDQRSSIDLLDELEEHPERFSPNVLLRPLYQETILPNVAYIGGGGELAYWLQLKPLFDRSAIPMPVLLLRTSVALLPQKEFRRMQDLGLSIKDLFLPVEELRGRIAREKAGFRTDMEQERSELNVLFEELRSRAASIDDTLERSAGSAAHLANKGLDHLEKRFVRAAKAHTEKELVRLQMILDVLFPAGGMQERRENFMTFYLRYGDEFFDILLKHLDPLDRNFAVLIEDPIDQ